MRGSKIRSRSAASGRLAGLMVLLFSSAAAADIYPVNGVWVAPNTDFPIGADEACFTVRLSGVDAVVRKSLAEILIFNENKRYDVKQNGPTISTLSSMRQRPDGYWVTEAPAGRKFWFTQKITYLLTVIDPANIEIRYNLHRKKFVKCGGRKLPI
jgi:hypothetical protein